MHGNDDGDLDDFWGKGTKRINVKKKERLRTCYQECCSNRKENDATKAVSLIKPFAGFTDVVFIINPT